MRETTPDSSSTDRECQAKPKADSLGYAQLARRVSSWTSKTLVSAIILVGGLAFGRQVLQWWSDDSPSASRPSAATITPDGFGDPSQLHCLEFGDGRWAISQQVFSGSQEKAATRLRDVAREAVKKANLPVESASPTETSFLKSLHSQQPVEEVSGGARLYELSQPFPVVVATRPVGPNSPAGSPPEGGEIRDRVVIWALAVPAAQDAWTIVALHPSTSSSHTGTSLPEVPLPPQSHRLVSMQAAGGGTMVSFRGDADLDADMAAWRQFYDNWLEQHGWAASGSWRRQGAMWHVRGVSKTETQAASLDVWIGPGDRGLVTGLLIVTPSSASESERL